MSRRPPPKRAPDGRLFTAILAACAACVTPTARAAGSSQSPGTAPTPGEQFTGWRHLGSTGQYPGKGFPTTWSETENLKWKKKMPGMTIAMPIVVGDQVFTIATPYSVIALDIHSGDINWQDELNPFELIKDPGLTPEQGAELLARLYTLKLAFGPTYGGTGLKRATDFAEKRKRAKLFLQRTKAAAALLPGFDAAAIDPAVVSPAEEKKPARAQAPEIDIDFSIEPSAGGEGLIDEVRPEPGVPADDRPVASAGDIKKLTESAYAPWRELKAAFYDRYAFHPDGNCQLHIGMAAATPVTDGSCICVAFGSGQVGCYELDGQRRWARLFTLPGMPGEGIYTAFQGAKGQVSRNWFGTGSGNYCSYVSSPVIVSGKLILYHHYRFHALDLKTGKTVWEHLAPQGHPTALAVLRIAPDDTEVVMTAGGTVIRVDNGKVLSVGLTNDRGGRSSNCEKADPSGWPQGAIDGAVISRTSYHSPTTDGKDVVFAQIKGTKKGLRGGGPYVAARLSLDSAGGLVIKTLWKTEKSYSQNHSTAILHNHLLYFSGELGFPHEIDGKVVTKGKGIIILDARTGKFRNILPKYSKLNLICADGYLIHSLGGNGKGPDWARCDFSFFTTGEKPTLVSTASIQADACVPDGVNPYFPEFTEWHEGRDKTALHLAAPVMYGDKVYYRSKTHLYCFAKR